MQYEPRPVPDPSCKRERKVTEDSFCLVWLRCRSPTPRSAAALACPPTPYPYPQQQQQQQLQQLQQPGYAPWAYTMQPTPGRPGAPPYSLPGQAGVPTAPVAATPQPGVG